MNGFDLTTHAIPLEEIASGGPPRDGIPALTNPPFIKAGQATYLRDEDRVLGLTLGREVRAYPIRILNWHEIVNDSMGDRAVVVTYCPLCGTGMAFDPVVDGKRLTFGVSGLLYNSDVLLYDRQTGSLWSQIKQEAVTGPLMGARLNLLFLLHTTWGEWRAQHPDTLVLSRETGHSRNYDRDPYADYAAADGPLFPVSRLDPAFPPKEWILGVEIGGHARAYPFSLLKDRPSGFRDQVGKKGVRIHFSAKTQTAYVTDEKGDPVPSLTAYWFAWYAFHPETTVYRPEDSLPR
ncbi:MAG: DUF3179 domain-containing protein [Nitrospirae bacterium]|nr:DUF3179 domain-containing protein [Nitrospirota bacterium]